MGHLTSLRVLAAVSGLALSGCGLLSGLGSDTTTAEAGASADTYGECADALDRPISLINDTEKLPEWNGTPEPVKTNITQAGKELTDSRDAMRHNAGAEKREAVGRKVEAVGNAAAKLPGIPGIIGAVVALGASVLVLTGRKKSLTSTGGK